MVPVPGLDARFAVDPVLPFVKDGAPGISRVLGFCHCASVRYVGQRLFELAEGHGYDELIVGEAGYSVPAVIGYEVHMCFTCNQGTCQRCACGAHEIMGGQLVSRVHEEANNLIRLPGITYR